MGAFNVAIELADTSQPLTDAVEAAMSPHKGTEWTWYAIGGYQWPEIYAHITANGKWIVGPPPHGVATITVRCKD